MAFSYWESTEWLEGRDLIIIGGGIVGLSAALQAKSDLPNRKVSVIERDPFGGGGSTKNAGFACFGSTRELQHDRAQLGDDAALSVLTKRINGLHKLRSTLGDDAMGYRACGSLELFRKQTEYDVPTATELKEINEWASEATGLSSTFSFADAQNLRGIEQSAIAGAVSSKLEGSVDTGKLIRSLRSRVEALGVDLLFGLEVTALEATHDSQRIHVQRSNSIGTSDGIWLETPHVIIATNGFARELLPDCDVSPQKNLVLVTEPITHLNFDKTVHMDAGYIYARNIANRMLIGGGRHWEFDNDEAVESALLQILHDLWPQTKSATIAAKWTGTLGVGKSREPIVAKVHPRCVAAVKMGGMGVAIGMQIGMESVALLFSD